MNKEQLVNKMAEESGLTKKASLAALNGLIEAVQNGIETDGVVSLVGFGVFEKVLRKARPCMSFKTMKMETLPEHYAVRFRPSKIFKNELKETE